MTLTIPNGPDEETPLLGGKQVSEIVNITEPESEASILGETSNEGSRTPSIKGRTNINKPAGVVKKTPLPWVQFCVVLFLQLPEPLTAQIIYPVSVLFSAVAPIYLIRSRNPFYPSFPQRSVQTLSYIRVNRGLTSGGAHSHSLYGDWVSQRTKQRLPTMLESW